MPNVSATTSQFDRPPKIPRVENEEIDISSLERDPRLRRQISKYPIEQRDKVRRAYIMAGPYQPRLGKYLLSRVANHSRILLTFQACALRGNDERIDSPNWGNFIELIKLLGSYNSSVGSIVLDKAPGNAQYISPTGRGRGRHQMEPMSMEHYYQINLFIATIDTQWQELNSRFSEKNMELLSLNSTFDPREDFKLFNVEHIGDLATKFYPVDFTEQEILHLRIQARHYELDVALYAPGGEAAMTCGQMQTGLAPCLRFLQGRALVPQCCAGIRSVAAAARTPLDRRAACRCMVAAAKSFRGINLGSAAALPGKCGVRIPFKISPTTDCARYLYIYIY
ncbi:hypothetical protein BUALT_Bualt09G0135500 [Buddleja alternifolia]|uniref:Non-specific lipid-transfer protein n=1 Tax=Buddleja alternifolia TaxID=168488 RepID=A0AAV6X2S8_9LAMI|nr:hypothetical protein BUALT_Bualt09G0135500 [Buddleja alternifolia]